MAVMVRRGLSARMPRICGERQWAVVTVNHPDTHLSYV
jgi:hypothetical protein